jgi:phage/plasmid-like protein (TIGR03299 family)
MAHEITNTDKMVYYGTKPWHDLGIEMPNVMTAAECYDAAFGWHVLQKELYFKDPNDVFTKAPAEYVANVRSDTNELLGIVSDQYKVVQPLDAFTFFDDVTMDPNGPKYVTAGSLKGGKKMWMLAKMPQFIEITDTDKYEDYLLLANSFDGSTGLQMLWTPVRVVCNNTLTMAMNRAKGIYKCKHYTGSIETLRAQDFLGIMRQNALDLKQFSMDLLNVAVDADAAKGFFVDLFPDSIVAQLPGQKAKGPVMKLMDLWESSRNDLQEQQGTAYYALNMVTDYIDHGTSFRSADTRMESLLMGQKSELKERAVELAKENWLKVSA